MSNSINLIGRKVHKLTVIRRVENYISPTGKQSSQWLCQCECGNQTVVRGTTLNKNRVYSCGCYKIERLISSIKKYNDYEIQEDYVIMYTNKNQMFLVDLDDFKKVRDICWHIDCEGYVAGTLNKKKVRLHCYLFGFPSGMTVDHIGGKLTRYDCRRSNLRVATYTQNNINKPITKRNSSGVVGVVWNKRTSKWRARIYTNKKAIYLGEFENKNDAIKVRKNAEVLYFGEYSFDKSQEIYEINKGGSHMITLYTTHCPRCTILEKKLKEANIEFTICDDKEVMLGKGMDLMPVLEVDDIRMNFKQACDWVNERS